MMKALVLEEYNKLAYRDVPMPGFDAADVLVNVKACGICGSDVHGLDGSTGRRQPPVIMGHEAAGVIVEIGSTVGDWHTGDRVTFDSTVYCGICRFCNQNKINLCDDRRVLGVSCDAYRKQGTFAEYVAVPHHILYRLPDSVTFEQAAMVEPLSIAVHAAGRCSCASPGVAVVVGSGMIGLLLVQVLRAAGAERIIAVDVAPDKLELARKLGADVALNARSTDVDKEVKALTDGHGADIAFEVVGTTAAITTCVESLRKGGCLTLVGNISPTVEIPLQTVVTREIDLRGSCASCGEYPACLDMIAEGNVDVETLTSAVAPLADGASWFKRLYDKEPGLMKVVLVP